VWRQNFEVLALVRWEFLPYDVQRLFLAMANASKSGGVKWATKILAAVGQTALSNYLGTHGDLCAAVQRLRPGLVRQAAVLPTVLCGWRSVDF
jgi:uncharacterized membrane protein YeiB